jgi:guanylate kinase
MAKKKLGKLIVVTAPSGAGKTTIVRHLLNKYPQLSFSVSATNRAKRDGETDGKDYYFFSTEVFREKVANGEFLEWEEVYDNQYYGTLKSEIERLWAAGKHIIFDVDVRGAQNIQQQYRRRTKSIFVKPPSREILFERLRNRKTETEESLRKRIARAEEELACEKKFDIILLNDNLEVALKEAEAIVEKLTIDN